MLVEGLRERLLTRNYKARTCANTKATTKTTTSKSTQQTQRNNNNKQQQREQTTQIITYKERIKKL